MDCNMRSPFQWDWEKLIMPNPSKTENDKKQLTSEWEIEKGEGIESIVPYLSGFERVSSGSATSFWQTKSSQSTSINSLSPEVKPGDSCSNIEAKASSTALEISAESDLCLKLGKRTYSEEELWGRNEDDISASLSTPSVVARKKSKSCGQSMQVPRCQIDGCELDLSSAKDYHRKHRVCENHSKCPKVFVAGLDRRFCQQCSRFHAVSEFDEKKRSCRKRLSHHNARRRKPKGVYPLNPVYDRRHHTTNMSWNGLSLNTRSEEKSLWGTTYETQMESGGGFTLSFQRGHGSEDHLFGHSFSAAQGVGEHSGGLHESQDFHRALSLLSTSSDSRGTKHNPSHPIFGTFPTQFI